MTKNTFWKQILKAALLFGAGTGASSAIAITIAVAPLNTQPTDLAGYLFAHPWPGLAVGMLVEALIGFRLYKRFVRKYEHREPTELSGPRAVRELLYGLAIGSGFIFVVMTILWLLGAYHPTGLQWSNGLLLGLALGLGGAFLEEPVFRGFLLRIFNQRWGATVAIIAISIIFGGIHIVNTLATGHISVVGIIAIMIESGLFFSAAYYLTRRLWLPIGIHLAWNTVLYGVFGMATSGIAGIGGLVNGTLSGSTWLTGGDFGPEASIVTIIIGVVAGIIMLWYAKRRNQKLSLTTAAGRNLS
jgi:hypothetical protein